MRWSPPIRSTTSKTPCASSWTKAAITSSAPRKTPPNVWPVRGRPSREPPFCTESGGRARASGRASRCRRRHFPRQRGTPWRPLGDHHSARLVREKRPSPSPEKPHPLLPLQPFRPPSNALGRRRSPALVRGKPQPLQTRRQPLAGRPTPPSQTQRRAQSGAHPQRPPGPHPLRARPAFGTLLRTLPPPPAPRPAAHPQGQSRAMSSPAKRPGVRGLTSIPRSKPVQRCGSGCLSPLVARQRLVRRESRRAFASALGAPAFGLFQRVSVFPLEAVAGSEVGLA